MVMISRGMLMRRRILWTGGDVAAWSKRMSRLGRRVGSVISAASGPLRVFHRIGPQLENGEVCVRRGFSLSGVTGAGQMAGIQSNHIRNARLSEARRYKESQSSLSAFRLDNL